MPRLRHFEVVAKDWVLRRDPRLAAALENKVTWPVGEHSPTIPFNFLIALACAAARTCSIV